MIFCFHDIFLTRPRIYPCITDSGLTMMILQRVPPQSFRLSSNLLGFHCGQYITGSILFVSYESSLFLREDTVKKKKENRNLGTLSGASRMQIAEDR